MTQIRNIPDGYHALQPYLMFEDCAAAMAFFAKVFGATQKLFMRSPEGRVVHAEISLAIP